MNQPKLEKIVFKIFNANNADRASVAVTLSGFGRTPEPFISLSNVVTLRFSTDASGRSRGFRALYSGKNLVCVLIKYLGRYKDEKGEIFNVSLNKFTKYFQLG